MRQAFLISTVLIGCTGVGLDQRSVESFESSIGPPEAPQASPWDPEQGTHILGAYPDSLTPPGADYLRVSSTPVFRTKFHLSISGENDGAHLVADSDTEHHDKDDAWFTDLILVDPHGDQLKITSASELNATDLGVVGVAASPSSTVYTLDFRPLQRDGSFGPWVDYCDGAGGAIALRGWYDADRMHQSDDTISFACGNGISYKCNFWGYNPGNAGPGSRGWDHHQACTADGNAMYCGDGQSFTREETPIRIRDDVPNYGNEDPGRMEHLPRDAWPGDPDAFFIESAWNKDGRPICLSKLRWVGLRDPCLGRLKDPRFTNDHEVVFCDQWTMEELFEHGALLVTGSKIMAAPLQRWRSAAGDVVSTTRGFFIDRDQDGVADADSTFPFRDANGVSPYQQYLGTDGMLFRNLPGTLSETQMRPLYTQGVAGADRFLSDEGAGRSDPRFEGYSFLDQHAVTSEGKPILGLQPLTQCAWRTGDQDSHLATGAPTGCTPIRSLSFALPAP